MVGAPPRYPNLVRGSRCICEAVERPVLPFRWSEGLPCRSSDHRKTGRAVLPTSGRGGPQGFQRLDGEGRRASNGWNLHRQDVPMVGELVQCLDCTALYPAGRPPALRAVMRPAIPPPGSPRASEAVTSSASPRPPRTRRASKAVTSAAALRSTPCASGSDRAAGGVTLPAWPLRRSAPRLPR